VVEAVCYSLCGIILSVMIIIGFLSGSVVKLKKDKEKKKRKSISRGAKIKSCLGTSMGGCFFVVCGPVFLYLAVGLSQDLIQDWQTFNLLKEKGHIENAPLVSVDEFRGNRWVVYEFNGTEHEQYISRADYEHLKNAASLEILVYEDQSWPLSASPRNDILTAIVPMGTIGFMVTGLLIYVVYRAIQDRLRQSAKLKREA